MAFNTLRVIRFKPEKGCKLSDGYPHRALPQQASCLLPHAQCYAHNFPSFGVITDLISERKTFLSKTCGPAHTSFPLFLPFFFLSADVLVYVLVSPPIIAFSLFVLFRMGPPVLWSFFSVHMLLELKVCVVGRRRRAAQPSSWGSICSSLSSCFQSSPFLSLSPLSLVLPLRTNKKLWPQSVGCITEEQRDLKQKICSQMTNQVSDVAQLQNITNICRSLK